jgi:hypothetical protein
VAFQRKKPAMIGAKRPLALEGNGLEVLARHAEEYKRVSDWRSISRSAVISKLAEHHPVLAAEAERAINQLSGEAKS